MNKNLLFKFSLGVILPSFFLAGCSDDDDPAEPIIIESSTVRVTHAAVDAPLVNIDVTGDTALSLTGVDYFVGSAQNTVLSGDYEIVVNANLPNDEQAAVISANLTLDADTFYDVVAVGSVAAGTLEAMVIADTGTVSGSDVVRVRVAHLSEGVGMVDVHVTAPEQELSATSVLTTLDYKEASGSVEVPGGDYRVRITSAGELTPVFDSGMVPLAGGSDLLVGAVLNTSTGDAPVNLIVLDGAGYSRIYDQDAGADFRAIHNAAAVAEVDVLVDNAKLLAEVGFTAVSGFVNTPADAYQVQITPANETETILLDESFELAANQRYSIMVLASDEDAILPFTSDLRSVATAAKTRIIHGSNMAGSVDIYLTPANDTLAGSADLSGLEPTLSDIPFLADTDFMMLSEGTYDVSITPADTPNMVAIFVEDLTINAGGVYTVIARDGAEGEDLGVILIDDSPLPN